MGVPCVVRDAVTLDGELIEDTFDWYAQDRDGDGLVPRRGDHEYEDGRSPAPRGTWRAGVDGALPGIVMPASPGSATRYRQEYYQGRAEDAPGAQPDQAATVPFGSYDGVLMTKDMDPLEPQVNEHKYYARIGRHYTVEVQGGSDRRGTGRSVGLTARLPRRRRGTAGLDDAAGQGGPR